ncbi:COQ9 family protein [Alphaproteobacteria bacterium]|nr:COQ9 family protein [Alphaproteobacteria bacterium]
MSSIENFKDIESNYKETILNEFLSEVPFTGWSGKTYKLIVKKLDLENNASGLFPNEVRDLTNYFFEVCENDLVNSLVDIEFSSLGIRDKIKTLIILRLKFYNKYKEALKSLILNNGRSYFLNSTKAVDIMWRLAGDNSTDYNYYTKRLILLTIYNASFFYWLDNDNFSDISSFLDRRLSDVMIFEKLKKKTSNFANRGFEVLNNFNNFVKNNN